MKALKNLSRMKTARVQLGSLNEGMGGRVRLDSGANKAARTKKAGERGVEMEKVGVELEDGTIKML